MDIQRQQTVSSPEPADVGRSQALDAYVDRFSDLFARTDQLDRFRVYLRGLLDGGPRKNVEAIAARSGSPVPRVAQALNHFISRSPWDAGRVVARYRGLVRPVLPAPDAWVVHDGVIEKKGRHSVGTQRQFARDIGRKVNCQVAVVVGVVGPSGYHPLAVRLYLPGTWLRENPTAVEKTVPTALRDHLTKPAIALALLDKLTAEGWPKAPVVGGDGYTGNAEFADGLAARSLAPAGEATAGPVVRAAAAGFEAIKSGLGLEHFEGRTWVGWHHHTAVVLAAHGFLVTEAARG